MHICVTTVGEDNWENIGFSVETYQMHGCYVLHCNCIFYWKSLGKTYTYYSKLLPFKFSQAFSLSFIEIFFKVFYVLIDSSKNGNYIWYFIDKSLKYIYKKYDCDKNLLSTYLGSMLWPQAVTNSFCFPIKNSKSIREQAPTPRTSGSTVRIFVDSLLIFLPRKLFISSFAS